MKRSFLFFLFLIVGFAPLFSMGSNEIKQEQIAQIDDQRLVVYTTSSFSGEYGPGPKIAERFKAKTGIQVEFIVCEEGVLNRSILESNKTLADVLLGIDNNAIEKARKAKILQPYHSADAENKISKDILFSKDWLLTPFDYGYFAFMFDTKSSVKPPKKLSDLTKDEYKNQIVIFDPRISTTGLGLVTWVHSVYQDKAIEFWKAFKPSIKVMAKSWSDGYPLLTKGEVPLVFSYTSSLAAHILWDKTDRFQPLIFEDGHITQIEGMGISSYSKRIKNAQKFIDFMLTKEAQELIPETNFMYPALKDLKLPESYKTVPQPKTVLQMPTQDMTSVTNAVINELQK